MSYARSRLLLGMSSVGTLVLISIFALVWERTGGTIGLTGLREDSSTLLSVFFSIAAIIGAVFIAMIPFDVLGGYWLPTRYHRQQIDFGAWLPRYLWSMGIQWFIYSLLGTTLVFAFRSLGYSGVFIIVAAGMVVSLAIRRYRFSTISALSAKAKDHLATTDQLLEQWQLKKYDVSFVNRDDPGFAGGIVGWGASTRIVIPTRWIDFPANELAVIIGRRSLAIESGSYAKGIVLSACWNAFGFLASLALSGGIQSVAGLVVTMAWFTLFSFLGLLLLPTLSRIGSRRTDKLLLDAGADENIIQRAFSRMDSFQDREPNRPALIESIFHPIPSVYSRLRKQENGWGAWQVARSTLFLSWACLGLLPRAVHCNVGRPDLWLLLPSD